MKNQDKNMTTKCGLSSLEYPQFSPGQLLDDDDLNSGVAYTRDLIRLLVRSLFGCGVICGLKVTPKLTCGNTQLSISVTKGLAVDCMGDVIELPADVTMNYGSDCQELPETVWVTICYIKKCCRPKDVSCSQDDSTQSKLTRVRSGYEIRLYEKLPKCACHCTTDDDNKRVASTDRCCDEQEPSAPAVADATAETTSGVTVYDCYKSHFDGECDCGCGCECVILCKINMPRGIVPAAVAETNMVRRIRPVLNGYIDCGSLRLVDPKRKRNREWIPKAETEFGEDQAEDPGTDQ